MKILRGKKSLIIIHVACIANVETLQDISEMKVNATNNVVAILMKPVVAIYINPTNTYNQPQSLGQDCNNKSFLY